ncbi:monomethylamine:corrinoid methyltransferase [Methanolobus sp. ZRKC2]|uniref:monomethylamine:corrinoid methyltransferase n=1 Tax=Methanolobus sp. ZRKC2 TaxID=3125783 RepID=UPI003243C04D
MADIHSYLRRAVNGEKKDEQKHDLEVFRQSQKLVSSHGITYDEDEFVPSEVEFADSVFEAALDLLLKVGIYCIDTGRVIKLDEDEILSSIKVPKTLEIGRFNEVVSVPNRYTMDSEPPVIIGGPMGGTVSEKYFLEIHLSSAYEPLIQGVYGGAMETMGGDYVQGNSPFGLLSTLKEARLERLSTKVASREGLALLGPCTPTSSPSYMLVSSDEMYSRNDPQEVYQLSEIKTDFETFNKSIFHLTHGNKFFSSQSAVLGGNSIGSAEGLAIVDVAETIQSKMLTGANFHVSGSVHASTNSSSAKEIIWASNMASIAISRNMQYYTARHYFNRAGSCTDMMFYETAAQAIGDTVSGRDILIGPVGGRGASIDQSSGLESRFMGEIAHMATHLAMEDANAVVNKIYSKYKDRLLDSPKGKPFNECYTLKSEYNMTPNEDYLNLYKKIFSEIESYC